MIFGKSSPFFIKRSGFFQEPSLIFGDSSLNSLHKSLNFEDDCLISGEISIKKPESSQKFVGIGAKKGQREAIYTGY